jgi:hypothetical protein
MSQKSQKPALKVIASEIVIQKPILKVVSTSVLELFLVSVFKIFSNA